MAAVAARGGESGSGTVWVLGLGVLLIMVAWSGALVAGVVAASHRADAAADLAALSAVTALTRAEDPCVAAERIARAHRARLAGCELASTGRGTSVTVAVEVPLVLPMPGSVADRLVVGSQARAGVLVDPGLAGPGPGHDRAPGPNRAPGPRRPLPPADGPRADDVGAERPDPGP